MISQTFNLVQYFSNFLFFLAFLPILNFKNVQSGDLILKIKNFDNQSGLIHIAIYNEQEKFPKKEGKLLGFKEKTSKIIENNYEINNLKEGIYAVAIFHDENSNDKFDSFFGIPNEKYGFSNNPSIFLSAPKFEQSSFDLRQNEKKIIEIELK
tara:strand:- start:44 stop:502 length:459 start_codon:yes stop_codon:yes gene_type:complete